MHNQGKIQDCFEDRVHHYNDLDARFTKSSTDNAVDINNKSIADCNINSCNHHHLILGEGMHTHSLRPYPSSVFDYQ